MDLGVQKTSVNNHETNQNNANQKQENANGKAFAIENLTEIEQKEMVLEEVKRYLSQLCKDDFASVTRKQVKQYISDKYGSTLKYELQKEDLSKILDHFAENFAQEDQKETDDLDQGDDEEIDEEDEDEKYNALPDDWKLMYGEVVWVKANKSFPWWPGYVYDPLRVSARLQQSLTKFIGKKHLVYNYGTQDYSIVSPNQIALWQEKLEENKTQKVTALYKNSYPRAFSTAEEEFAKDKEDRVAWNHKSRARKSVGRKEAVHSLSKRKSSEEPDVLNTSLQSVKIVANVEDTEKAKVHAPSAQKVSIPKQVKSIKMEKDSKNDEELEDEFEAMSDTDDSETKKKKRKKLKKASKEREKSDASKSKEVKKKSKERLKSQHNDSAKSKKRSNEDVADKSHKKAKDDSSLDKKKSENTAMKSAKSITALEFKKEDVNETRVQRAIRLTKLIEEKVGQSKVDADKVVKTLDKIKSMNLNLDELLECKFGETLNKLRKHSNVEIANAAKDLRAFLKDQTMKSGHVGTAETESKEPCIPVAAISTHQAICTDQTAADAGKSITEEDQNDGKEKSEARIQSVDVLLSTSLKKASHEAAEWLENVVWNYCNENPVKYSETIQKFSFALQKEEHHILRDQICNMDTSIDVARLIELHQNEWSK